MNNVSIRTIKSNSIDQTESLRNYISYFVVLLNPDVSSIASAFSRLSNLRGVYEQQSKHANIHMELICEVGNGYQSSNKQ